MFLAMLPQVLAVLRQKLMRVGDPSLSNHPSCVYNKLDFDSLEEYNYFFSSEVMLSVSSMHVIGVAGWVVIMAGDSGGSRIW